MLHPWHDPGYAGKVVTECEVRMENVVGFFPGPLSEHGRSFRPSRESWDAVRKAVEAKTGSCVSLHAG
jgi:hypothetical protein